MDDENDRHRNIKRLAILFVIGVVLLNLLRGSAELEGLFLRRG